MRCRILPRQIRYMPLRKRAGQERSNTSKYAICEFASHSVQFFQHSLSEKVLANSGDQQLSKSAVRKGLHYLTTGLTLTCKCLICRVFSVAYHAGVEVQELGLNSVQRRVRTVLVLSILYKYNFLCCQKYRNEREWA